MSRRAATNFYPRPPRGGRRRSSQRACRSRSDFYPRPPRGGRLCPVWPRRGEWRFLSTPSARRATSTYRFDSGKVFNFYPRPPRGGRPDRYEASNDTRKFLSTPSARRATSPSLFPILTAKHFYPRPPRGGRPVPIALLKLLDTISIHALREEGDQTVAV